MLELSKMQGTLSQAIRLNKTLLLLTRIDNGQFPESSDVDIAAMLRELQQMYADIYSEKQLRFSLDIPGSFTQKMNESLASVLLSNLLKNACIHSRDAAQVSISLRDGLLEVANGGDAPLDATRIFERFYQGSKKEGPRGSGWPSCAPWPDTTAWTSATASQAACTASASGSASPDSLRRRFPENPQNFPTVTDSLQNRVLPLHRKTKETMKKIMTLLSGLMLLSAIPRQPTTTGP